MADKVPIRYAYDGSSLTGIAEYATSDTVGIAFGGTGATSLTDNGILIGNATSAIQVTSALTTNGQIVIGGTSGPAVANITGTSNEVDVTNGDGTIAIGLPAVVNVATCVITPKVCITSQYVLPAADGSAGQIMCTDGSGTTQFAAAASSGHTIAEEGSALASRTCLNFIGSAVTAADNSGTNATDVTVCATSSLLGIRAADGTACCITLSSAAVGESLVSDTTPQLGGNLDVNGNSIVSDAGNENIPITPHGTGSVVISKISVTGDSSLDGGTFVFNESGADKDFRVEGDTDANLFISDASTDRIGIGTATPSHLLDVDGVANVATCLITPKICVPTAGFVSGYTLPSTDGSAGTVMCTDGSGALGFATISAGVTLAGSTNNTIATVTGADALAGEANLTFDGSTLGVTGTVGINTTAVPHGGVGAAKLAIDGTNASTSGPHVQFTTASTDYPLLQIFPWAHDNIHLTFDGYFDGSNNKSSSSTGTVRIQKTGADLDFLTGAASAGATVTLSSKLSIIGAGDVNVRTGNLVIGTSGKGIDFSATGDGSGTDSSELLDDYEEGTFTPACKYTPEGGSATAYSLSSNTYAAYTKIGQFVWFNMQIQLANAAASNAADAPITFTGLPYAAHADNPGSNQFSYSTYPMRANVFNEANAVLAPYQPSSSSEVNGFVYYNNGTAWSSLMSDMIYVAGGTNHLQISGMYRAA